MWSTALVTHTTLSWCRWRRSCSKWGGSKDGRAGGEAGQAGQALLTVGPCQSVERAAPVPPCRPTFFMTSTGQVAPAMTPVRSEPSWCC